METRYRWMMWVASALLIGCTSMAEKQEPERRAQFESSIDVYRSEHSGRPGFILDALTKKQIIPEMNLDEVRLSLDAQGIIGKQTERLWCEKKPVSECPANCANCRGLIVTRWGSVIYLKGQGTNPLVFELRHTENDRPQLGAFLASDMFLSYEIARAIEAGQVIVGMTLDQVAQTLPGHVLGETYKCNNIAGAACAADCPRCEINFVWQGQAVVLERKEKDPTARVTRITPLGRE